MADLKFSLGRIANRGLNTVGLKLVLADSFVVNSEWAYRLLYFRELFELIKEIDGDVVECGVGGGYSLAMFMVLTRIGKRRHIIGFDSFNGLPEPTLQDLNNAKVVAKKGALSSPESIVWNTLKTAGLDGSDSITVVKGWFDKTIPKYKGAIALLHLDADLYESTKCALDILWDKVAVNGIVALDEYQKTDIWPGEKMAVDEFIASHKQSSELCHGTAVDRYYIRKTQ